MSARIDKLQQTVEEGLMCKARHLASTPVAEYFDGAVVWEGIVETFELIGYATADRCYAFEFIANDQPQVKTVLGVPWITSPRMALRVALAAESQRRKKPWSEQADNPERRSNND